MSTIDTQDIGKLIAHFHRQFGRSVQDVYAFFAPGRVNLIGEYTDFTGGLVFPCGINQGTTLLIRPTGNGQYRFASRNLEQVATLSQEQIHQKQGDAWFNYPLGVLDQFAKRGARLTGFDFLYSGNVPNGAGLSSSASLEVVTAFAINQLLQAGCSLLELVQMSQSAEKDFVGMQCGIMDQFAVGFAQSGHAMMLDCHSIEHRQVPMQMNDLAIVISNTNQRRELNDSAYNDRVRECQRALDLLTPSTGIAYLGQLTPEQLKANELLFGQDTVSLMRARHVTEENERVRSAVPALEAGDMHTFGRLMNASHDSLRDLFEVSSEPLDQLVGLAREQPGVLGSRLTGAGFGGCTVSLVPQHDVDSFIGNVGAGYRQATGLEADFYTIKPSDGVRELEVNAE